MVLVRILMSNTNTNVHFRAAHKTIAIVLLIIFENKYYTIPYCNSFREAQQ
jgi:hypothetical protein